MRLGCDFVIEVRLFATFRENRQKILFLQAEDYKNTRAIIEKLGIPEEEVAILLINGRHSNLHTPVNDGDIIALFPPVGGG